MAITYNCILFTNVLLWYEFEAWGYVLINEVYQWFYQLSHVTFSENIFWSVNYISNNCFEESETPESVSRKNNLATFMTLSIDAIYQ